MSVKSHSPGETAAVAGALAKEVLKNKKRDEAFVVGLTGNLGSGKTTFIQGFAKGLGLKNRILSPTFLIIRSYKLPITNYKFLFHIDAYRIKKPNELEILGFKKIIGNPQNIVLVEWAEKIKRLLPKNALWVKFDHRRHRNERKITFKTR